MDRRRVLKTQASNLTKTLTVGETATDAGGTVSVAVTRLDGTLLATGNASDAEGTGAYSYILPGGKTAPGSVTWQLDHLNVTWSASFAGASMDFPPDRIEVVGGWLFGLPEARRSDESLSSAAGLSRYDTQQLEDRRLEVEDECERICGQAFVPRFGRAVLSGNGSAMAVLPHQNIRRIRAVLTRFIGGTLTAVGDLDDISWSEGGVVTRFDGGIFPYGSSNVVIEYEHGWDAPPEDLKEAAMMRFRSRLNMSRSGVEDRATTWTTADGTTYQRPMPTEDRYGTGIPEVDAVYRRYSAAPVGFA